MLRSTIAAALLGSTAFVGLAFAQDRPVASGSIQLAQSASSCSGWKAICDSRGPGCDAKFRQCMKSGCWTEGAKYGGGTHCSLTKR